MGKHAIIIIKNNDNKYLQVYDNRWDSYLFPNMKLDEGKNSLDIKNYLEKELDCKVVFIDHVKTIEHEKYSVSHQEMRKYIHYFYIVKLENYDINYPNNYKYFSIEELENNERIMEVNSDIVGYVKEIY